MLLHLTPIYFIEHILETDFMPDMNAYNTFSEVVAEIYSLSCSLDSGISKKEVLFNTANCTSASPGDFVIEEMRGLYFE